MAEVPCAARDLRSQGTVLFAKSLDLDLDQEPQPFITALVRPAARHDSRPALAVGAGEADESGGVRRSYCRTRCTEEGF